MNTPIVAANWKMNLTPKDVTPYFSEFTNLVDVKFQSQIYFFPPTLCLESIKNNLQNTTIQWGAQNCYFENSGAFTGETSPQSLHDFGVPAVLIGHSERRQIFQEDDQTLALKVKAALENKLTVMFCVGETLEQREQNQTEEVVKRQLTEGLRHFTSGQLILAYEPIWAIGTGKVATAEIAQQTHQCIRQILKNFEQDLSYLPLLYGGSVKAENSLNLIQCPDVDGFLVGGASLQPQSFAQICNSAFDA